MITTETKPVPDGFSLPEGITLGMLNGKILVAMECPYDPDDDLSKEACPRWEVRQDPDEPGFVNFDGLLEFFQEYKKHVLSHRS